jgi:hypothetical protein
MELCGKDSLGQEQELLRAFGGFIEQKKAGEFASVFLRHVGDDRALPISHLKDADGNRD